MAEKEKEKVLTSLADVEVGMKLEAMDKYGKWYVAKVIEVDEDDGDVLVHFEGWSSRYDEYVEVKGGRLRTLSSSKMAALLKEKKSKKNLNIGDRVQAKWEDGRMYFGKVLMIRGDNVEVQFDDGVYYTAPLSRVRKRNMDKTKAVTEDYLREPSVAAAIDARKRRAEKRQRSDDSASQTSLSSPPSSPIFMPKKSKPLQCISDDSTETDSDFDDERRIRIREKPVSTHTKTTDTTAAASSKGGSKSSSPISSDSEQPRPPSSRKKKYDAFREPYKLRGVVQMSRLSPVDEDPTASISTNSEAQVGSAFLTPPFESQSLVKPTQQPLSSSSGPSPKPSLGSTPPETPKLGSHSQKSVKSASTLASGSGAEEAHASVHGKKSESDSDNFVAIKLGDSRGSSLEVGIGTLLEDRESGNLREEETPLGKRIESLLYCEEDLFTKRRLNWSDTCSDSSSPSLTDRTSVYDLCGVATASNTASHLTTCTLASQSSEPAITSFRSRTLTPSVTTSLTLEPAEVSFEQALPRIASSSGLKSSATFSSCLPSATDQDASPVVVCSPPFVVGPQSSDGRVPEKRKAGREREHRILSSIEMASTVVSSGRLASTRTAESKALVSSRNTRGKMKSGITGKQEKGRASKRIVSDSAAPSPSKLTQTASPTVSKKQSSLSTAASSSSSSVATRTRAQTKFGVVVKKSEKKTAKLAPKELVIMWDHNEYKCQFTGCSKSFRKESLLLSHIKHYHHVKPKTPPAKGKGAAAAKLDSKSPLSPRSPRMSPRTPIRASPKSRSPKSRALHSPKSPSLKSILSPPQPKEETTHVSFKADPLRRSKSPTESFFESMEKQQRSVEVLKLLEQSAREQAAALLQKSPPVTLLPGVCTPAEIAAGPTALRFQLQESSITGGTKTATRTQEVASAQPSIQEAQKPKPKSSSKPSASSSKKLKHVAIGGLMSGTPRKVPLVEIKALPREILPPSPTKKLQSPGKSTFSPTQNQKSESATTPTRKETGVLQLEGGGECLDEEMEGGRDEDAKSLSMESEGNEDDVVHCVCGSEVDEGFMIQCEQCLCWQHGDCIGITKETLPEKYICYICINPPGLRTRMKHRFDREWFAEGSLPSLPGGPKFTETAAIHLSHQLADSLYKLRKMVHSTKVKLQAASNPHHPYLRQWAKECAHLSQDDIMSYLITALQPVSYDSEGTKESSVHPTTSRTDSSAGVKDAQEVDENNLRENANSDVNVPPEKLSSSPINIAALHLEPLPYSCSVTPTLPLPVSSSSSSSLTTTIESSSFDAKSLKLAPLPPLSVEDLHNMTAVILKSSVLQSTPTVTQTTHQTSRSTMSESVPKSASFEPLLELSLTENPIPSSEKPVLDLEDTKDSFGSSLEMNEEFGVQEMSVFAVDDTGAHHLAIESKTSGSEMPVFAVGASTSPSEAELKPRESEQNHTKSPPVSSHLRHSITTSAPIPIPSPSKLVSSSRSAFKPVIIPLTTSSASNHLTSLLASQKASTSNGRPPTTSGLKSSTSTSASLDHRQQPKAEGNPNSLQTLSSAKSTMDTVTLGKFAEAFMHGDTTNWVNRMLLFDHVEAVQNKVIAWMELIEKQLEEIPCDDSSLKDMTTLLMDVQAVVRQLGQIRQIASSCQVEA